jgi:hypothetical protein
MGADVVTDMSLFENRVGTAAIAADRELALTECSRIR